MNLSRTLSLLVCLLCLCGLGAQPERFGPQTRVSVITCGPGTDLYAIFGHSAFRIRDAEQGIDWVYNYGTFDFDTPNFYLKFAQGKLPYALSRSRFESFLYTYQLEKRWVREQVLDLDSVQKWALYNYLEENNRPENRYYTYDFLFENCATKIPTVLREVLGPELELDPDFGGMEKSFRDLIQENLQTNSWSSLGIDLALGAVVDRTARPVEYQFLPVYVRRMFADSRLNERPLVERERVILDLPDPEFQLYFMASPLFWFLFILLFTVAISWIDYRNGTRSRWLDFFLFLITGIGGLTMVFLWFFTDHTATVWNANLLWAFPVNIVFAALLLRRRKPDPGLTRYLRGLLALLAVCLILWITGVQDFHPVLPVFWLALVLRYGLLIHHLKPTK